MAVRFMSTASNGSARSSPAWAVLARAIETAKYSAFFFKDFFRFLDGSVEGCGAHTTNHYGLAASDGSRACEGIRGPPPF
jgi:hypothetical protein